MRERLEREAREKGWGAVAARHLREGAPTVLISVLVVDGLVSEKLEGDPLDVRGENLSTHPRLAGGAPRVSVRSRSGRIDFEVVLGGPPAAGGAADAAPGRVALAWRRLATDDVLGRLRLSREPIVSGGTLDLDLRGAWSGGDVGRVDLPLRVTVRDALWRIGGSAPTPVEELLVPFGLRGPIDDPRISFDAGDLASALVDAGKAGLAKRLEAEAGEELDDLLRKGEEELGEELDPELREGAKGLLNGLFGDD
jgi:hypothetical protein